MFDSPALLKGFALGFGIFVCPGPKDVLILRQALLGRSPFTLITIGSMSDALLIGLGMAGLSAVFDKSPFLQSAALWFGACLLLGNGLVAARRAMRGSDQASVSDHRHGGLTSLLAVSLLNPVAWLDAVLIVGSVGAALPRHSQASFGLGAVVASMGWFLVLVLGAQGVARWMTSSRAWRLLDALTAIAMLALAINVVWDLIPR